jgi:hypothetical protein
VAGFCEHGNGLSCSIRMQDFFHKLSDNHLHRVVSKQVLSKNPIT